MDSVRTWLENPDYDGGVKLYIQYGANEFLKNIFQNGENDYTRKKLFQELSELSETIGNSSERSELPEIRNIELSARIITTNSHLLTKLRKDRQQIYRQIDANMHALAKARSVVARRETAFQILRLQKKKQQLLDEIDHLEVYGMLPEKPEKSEFVTSEIQRLYVQIWKTKKRLERTDLRNRERTEKLLKEKLQLLEELRKEAANG